MDADHDDDGATFSGNEVEEMAMQKNKKEKETKRKHFDIKEPASALSQRSIHVPTKEKQNSGGDGSF